MLWYEHVSRSGKLLVLGAARYSGVLGWLRKRSMQNQALILMYHRVTPHGVGVPDYSPNGIAVTPEEFAMQIQYLRRHYDIVPLARIVGALRGRQAFTPGMAAITFDDGWQDVYEYAFPIMKRYTVPATLYLTTGFIDGKKWYWEERLKYLLALVHQACWRDGRPNKDQHEAGQVLAIYALDYVLGVQPRLLPLALLREGRVVKTWARARRNQLLENLELLAIRLAPHAPRPFMNWREIMEMSQHNLEVANHTDTHQILSELSADEAAAEINLATDRIREQVGQSPTNFAYPYGKYNDEIRARLTKEGMDSAVTTQLGLVWEDADPYALNRINMCSDVCGYKTLFAGRILGI